MFDSLNALLKWICPTIVLVTFLVYLIYKYAHGNDGYWNQFGIPILLKDELISLWAQLTLKYHYFEIDEMFYKRMKDMKLAFVGTMEFRSPIIVIRDLDLIRSILVKDFSSFVNHRQDKPIPDSSPGFPIQFGLLLSRNQERKDLRTLLSPAYSTARFRKTFPYIKNSGNLLLEFIRGTDMTSTNFNVTDLLRRTLIHSISEVGFGIDSHSFDSNPSQFYSMAKKFEIQFSRIDVALKIYPLLLTGKRFNLIKHLGSEIMDFFKSSLLKTVDYRREHGIKRDDFLNHLLEIRDHATKIGSPINLQDENVLFAQTIVFLLVGYINMLVLSTYTIYEITRNPDVQKKLRAEVTKIFQRDNMELTYDGILDMKYLDMIITETMRLYNTANGGVRLDRQATKDYQIPGTNKIIPKGTVVIIPSNAIHHDEEIYPNPNNFCPSRWKTSTKGDLHPCAYMPFGFGPRACIAKRSTLIQVKTLIAQLIHSFKFEPNKLTPIPMKFSWKNTAMTPAGDLFINITPVKSDTTLSRR